MSRALQMSFYEQTQVKGEESPNWCGAGLCKHELLK